jgi:hypothetical protein
MWIKEKKKLKSKHEQKGAKIQCEENINGSPHVMGRENM